jgi:uncharacterized membrane protein
MRTTKDRVRHTILFEIFGIALCTPLASMLLGKSLISLVSMSIMISIIAMIINYLFNYWFDKTLIRLNKPLHVRPVKLRILHATLFEVTLLVVTVPLVAWWLDMSLLAAFFTDIGFSFFFLIYAFVYNWAYDTIFPIPVHQA